MQNKTKSDKADLLAQLEFWQLNRQEMNKAIFNKAVQCGSYEAGGS